MRKTEREKKMAEALATWYPQHKRDLPWREDRDPYHIWISEIMLQQTRVSAVVDYYKRFLAELPDAASLAFVSDERLMKLWQGLGYYRRAANLKKAAEVIVSKYGGVFPDTYEAIRGLPGIGDYTAGAIASIAYGLPTPAVDGNCLRVYARVFAYAGDIAKESTKREVREALLPMYRQADPMIMTQSLMELGACVCVPNGAPDCGNCPLASVCLAKEKDAWQRYPVKQAKPKRRIEKMEALVLICGDKIAIKKRPETGLLANLWEFPNHSIDGSDVHTASAFAGTLGAAPSKILVESSYRHIFTHVEWQIAAYCFLCEKMPEDLTWVTREELVETYAVPSAFAPMLALLDTARSLSSVTEET